MADAPDTLSPTTTLAALLTGEVRQLRDKSAVAIIADDEELGRLLLSEAAASVGLASLVYDNGASALEAALSREPAIVLLDVDMPGLDGFTVCRRLRADKRFATVPVVMVTTHDDSAAIQLAFDAGATDFISKPVNWDLLPRRLEYILRNASVARALDERVNQVRTLVEALPDTLWLVTPDGRIQWSPNAGFADRGAVFAPDAVAVAIAPLEHLQDALAAVRDTAQDGIRRKLEYRLRDESGERNAYELRFSRRDGGDVLVVRRNVTELTVAAERIERLAYFDPLTGLPNRQRCLDAAEVLIEKAARLDQSVAVIYLNLNSFKRVNDAFGHALGDAVLRTFATRLTRLAHGLVIDAQNLLVARFGGDEFVIVLRDAQAREVGMALATKCSEDFKSPIICDSLEFHSAPNIGVAVCPDDGADMQTILKHADTAMHKAKSNGTGAPVMYESSMSSRLHNWLELERRLRRALQTDQLRLVFQPKFRLKDNVIVGAEALLRWRDAELGVIAPSRFIEIAEDSGLILELSRWVAYSVCRQLRDWHDLGLAIPIAINCSGKELLHGDPARVVEAAAAAAGVPASLIEIEITESLFVKDSPDVQSVLARLRRLGCQIALDDFGTGYASLAYITRFPPDRIKIDKAFVREVDCSASNAAIASAILSIAATLNLTVTAEGIERPGQLEWLRARGCHEGQGFLLCPPLSAQEFAQRFLISVPARAAVPRSM